MLAAFDGLDLAGVVFVIVLSLFGIQWAREQDRREDERDAEYRERQMLLASEIEDEAAVPLEWLDDLDELRRLPETRTA